MRWEHGSMLQKVFIKGSYLQNPRSTLLSFPIALSVLITATGEASACANSGVVARAGATFIKAARSQSSAAFSYALNRYVDLGRVSMLALGKHRNKATSVQRAQIKRLTGRYVARNLAQFSGKFKAQSLKVVRCRGSIVETKLLRLNGGVPQKLLWRVRGGKITDLNVQNVWLAQLLKSNYQSIIRSGRGDVSALIVKLGGSRNRAAGTSK